MRWIDGSPIGRNDQCRCRSGRKLKNCCLKLLESGPIDPKDLVGVFLTSADLWPETPTLDDVRRSVRRFDGRDLIQSVAKIGLLTHQEYFKPTWIGSREREILKRFLPEVWFRKVDIWRATGRRLRVIHRLLIPAAIQMALVESRFDATGLVVQGNEHQLGELLLHLNTHLENDSEPKLTSEGSSALFASMYRNHYLSRHNDFGSNLGRSWALLKKGLEAVSDRHPTEPYDFAAAFAKAFGFSHDHMVSMAFAVFTHYRLLIDRPFPDPKDFLLAESFFAGLRPEAATSAPKIFAYLASSWEEHVEEMRRAASRRPESLLQFLPLYNRPMVEGGHRAYLPLDMLFLEDAISEGAYWALFLHLLKQDPNEEAARFRSAFGRAVEWYAFEYLRETFSYDATRRGWFDWDRTIPTVPRMRTPDAVLQEGKTLYVVEVTASSILPSEAVSGDAEVLLEGLRRVWFGRGERRESAKLMQLEAAAGAIRDGRVSLPGLEPNSWSRVVPVFVNPNGFPQNEIMWMTYRQLFTGNGLTSDFARSLILLDLRELEALCLLKENGNTWEGLFAQWRASPRGEQSFHNFINIDLNWPGRHPRLDSAMREAFDAAARFAFGRGLDRGTPPRLEE